MTEFTRDWIVAQEQAISQKKWVTAVVTFAGIFMVGAPLVAFFIY